MRVVIETAELHEKLNELKNDGQRLAFVPTMGALHEGHLSLVRLARRHADRVAVSIFVNPLQFGAHEDFRVYPRTPERDYELLEKEHVDLIFMPTAETMYRAGWTVSVHPGPVGCVYEGKIRPGHFQGVLTVVAKLFHLADPDVAVFGEKDAQQLFLIRRMVEDLNFRVRVIGGETLREPDGLATSSRNVFLTGEERKKADVVYRAMLAGRSAVLDDGVRKLSMVQEAMRTILSEVPEFRVDYATAVGDKTFSETDPLPEEDIRLIVAGRFSTVRLIDNLHVSLES